MVPALFGVSHGALQFMAYEELKKWRFKVNKVDSEKDHYRLVRIKVISIILMIELSMKLIFLLSLSLLFLE